MIFKFTEKGNGDEELDIPVLQLYTDVPHLLWSSIKS